jgi:hypothetical protein
MDADTILNTRLTIDGELRRFADKLKFGECKQLIGPQLI